MFCYQCEQTSKGGCKIQGVCGKDNTTAILQDVLLHLTKGVSVYSTLLSKMGVKSHEADLFVVEALFTTVTNVNFDPDRLIEIIKKGKYLKNGLESLYLSNGGKEIDFGPALFQPAENLPELISQGENLSILKNIENKGPDITGLEELLTYGLKGTAAYADHAYILGKESDEIYLFFHEALDFLSNENHTVENLVAMNLKCGEFNLKTMELLDSANTGAYGDPVPVKVRIEPLKGKAILVSGHDLKDLEELLKQTEGKGINVYTHGEMLPAHGYPALKKYSHLVGNYGGAWQDQRNEFDLFPGAILMTTNCIQKPKESYKGRIFTSGLVAWPGVEHIGDRNFSAVINAALEAEGFKENGSDKTILVGFGHKTILDNAGAIINAVKQGKIRHFFLIGGCDGAKSGRNYYTEFAQATPDDTIILTLACGKFRFNKLDFGEVAGLPRLLDVGQCNDAYSAIVVAKALAGAFETDVNGLPLSLVLSWYEQKAVCILLSLLYLGIKNIRLGPSLPEFITPAVLDVLVKNFNIMPISTVENDLKAILG